MIAVNILYNCIVIDIASDSSDPSDAFLVRHQRLVLDNFTLAARASVDLLPIRFGIIHRI